MPGIDVKNKYIYICNAFKYKESGILLRIEKTIMDNFKNRNRHIIMRMKK